MYYKYKYSELFNDVPKTDFAAEDGNIVIYGAGFQGLLTSQLLKEQGVKVLCFCDIDEKKQGTFYNGVPVFSPIEAKKMYPDALVIVTPYTIIPAYRYVRDVLKFKKIITPVHLFLEFESDGFEKLSDLPDWYHVGGIDCQLDLFMRNCNNLLNENKMYSLDVSVTEVCNLKCKHCTSFMPCYEKPKHYTLEDMKDYMEIVLKGRVFHHVNIEGGEAFCWKALPDFLEFLCDKPNVLGIYLCTNGTILPCRELLDVLKNEKITMRISDYGKQSKIKELTEIFTAENIRYRVIMQQWYELSSFHKEPKKGEELKQIVESCCKSQPDGNGTTYLMDGKLFFCPIQGNLHNLGIFESSCQEIIDLRKNSNDLQERIDNFFLRKGFPKICAHCVGRAYTGREVEPAIQLKPGEKIAISFE